MKYYKLLATVIFLIYLSACSFSDNQRCNTDSLLEDAQNGYLDKMETCYKSGANIEVSDKEGTSIYAIALKNDHKELATRLQSFQLEDWEKNNSLMEAQFLYNALEYNNVPMVRKFIEGGFDMTAKHINGVAPIVYAVFNESNEVVELLLKSGVDVTYEFDFRPLLCLAAMFNQLETAEILVNNGADVNANDGSGVTPLMFAARDGYTEVVQYLLDRGADKTTTDIKDQTALDMARAKGHEEVVELLK